MHRERLGDVVRNTPTAWGIPKITMSDMLDLRNTPTRWGILNHPGIALLRLGNTPTRWGIRRRIRKSSGGMGNTSIHVEKINRHFTMSFPSMEKSQNQGQLYYINNLIFMKPYAQHEPGSFWLGREPHFTRKAIY